MESGEVVSVVTDLLRRHDPSAYYDAEAATFVFGAWEDRTFDPPLRLHATSGELERAVQIDEAAWQALWPEATRRRAGLNLFLVHLMEAVVARDPRKRHLFIAPDGVVASSHAGGGGT